MKNVYLEKMDPRVPFELSNRRDHEIYTSAKSSCEGLPHRERDVKVYELHTTAIDVLKAIHAKKMA